MNIWKSGVLSNNSIYTPSVVDYSMNHNQVIGHIKYYSRVKLNNVYNLLVF